MDQGIDSLVTGLAKGIDAYLGTSLQQQQQMRKMQAEKALELQNKQTEMATKSVYDKELATHQSGLDLQKGQQLEGYKAILDLQKQKASDVYKLALEGKVDANTASAAFPHLAEMVDHFTEANGRAPTVDEFNKLETSYKAGQAVKDPNEAKKRVSDNLSRLGDLYKSLDKMGGIVNTEKNALSNVSARLASSAPGQGTANALGTKTQSLRNQIASMRPLLINDIRQATNMGARGLDSEKELEFYLKAATDPTVDLQTNLKAIQTLDQAYGLGLNVGKDSPKGNSDPLGLGI